MERSERPSYYEMTSQKCQPVPRSASKNPAKKAQREYSGVAPVPPRHLGGLISDHTGKLKGKGGGEGGRRHRNGE